MKKAQVPEKSVLTSWFSQFTGDNKEEEETEEDEEEEEEEEEKPTDATPKRGRGRPRLTPKPTPSKETPSKSDDQPKRGRGRPKKNPDDGETPVKKKETPVPKTNGDVTEKEVEENPAGPGKTRRGTRVTDLRTKLDTSVEESPGGERKSTRKKTVFTCDECKETFQMEYLLLVHKKRCKRESLLTSPPKTVRKTPAKTNTPQKKPATAGGSQSTTASVKKTVTSEQGKSEQEKKSVESGPTPVDISTVIVAGSETIVITESIENLTRSLQGAVEPTEDKTEEVKEGEERGEEMEVDKEKAEEGQNEEAQSADQEKEEEQEAEEEEMEEEEEEDDGGEWRPSQSDDPPPAKRRRGRGPSRRALAMIQDDDEDYKGSKRKRKILLNMKQAIQVLKLTPKRKVHPDSGMEEVNRATDTIDPEALLKSSEESAQAENNEKEQAEEEGTGERAEEEKEQEKSQATETEDQAAEEGDQKKEQPEVKVKEEKLPLKVVVESLPSDEERELSEADYLDVAEIEKMVDLTSSDCAICGMRFKDPKYMRKHLITHSGQKNYGCNVCKRKYMRRYDLHQHLIRMHGWIKLGRGQVVESVDENYEPVLTPKTDSKMFDAAEVSKKFE
ncbi:glutamic acid-rich protein-like [Saccostrea cucullata]|uniref:glutamic acid-rich protein-like n=1 Tax=Saccostrea cuccullata TaxID=36930 RepID=UPI002ED2BAE5